MSKLTVQGSSQNRPFKPKIYQGQRRGQTRNYYNQDRCRSNTSDNRMSYRGRDQYGHNHKERSQYGQNYRGDFRRGNFKGMQNYRGQILKEDTEAASEKDNFGIGRSRSRERQ